MLVLSRKVGESILIGEDVTITIVRIAGGGVRVGIEAPPELSVVRRELKGQFNRAGGASQRTWRRGARANTDAGSD